MYSVYSVIDTKSTILVSREGDNFVVKDLSTEESIILNSSKFYGNCFKYECDFLCRFASAFKDKKVNNILLSSDASDYMNDLICFNRIDN